MKNLLQNLKNTLYLHQENKINYKINKLKL